MLEVLLTSGRRGGGASSRDVPLLLHFDGAESGEVFTDSSLSPKIITRTGSIVTRAASAKFGSTGAYTPGGSDLQVADAFGNDGLGLLNDDFTIEGWFYTASAGYSAAWHFGYGASNQYSGLLLTVSGLFVSLGGTAWDVFAASTGAWNDSAWHHMAVCRSDGTLRVYNNGVRTSTTVVGEKTIREVNPGRMMIGNQTTSGNFVGSIDELRITKMALYTNDFDAPTSGF